MINHNSGISRKDIRSAETARVLTLLEKINAAEKINKLQKDTQEIATPKFAPNQQTLEVRLPVSYRQWSAIQ